jgi:hypothetical protein
MNGRSKYSPALQALIDKGLFDRLPPTFSTFFFEQIQDWVLLFPAERSYYERLFGMLDRSDPPLVDVLFASLRRVEQKMGVNEKIWPRQHFTLEQVDFLNRSPFYPEWRKAVADIFAKVDPLLDQEVEAANIGNRRLVVVIAPAELPVGPDRMWTRIRQHGKRISIQPPDDIPDYLPLLLTGEKRDTAAPNIAQIFSGSKSAGEYSTWTIESGGLLSGLIKGTGSTVSLSYDHLKDYRARLMTEVRRVVQTEQVRGPRQLGAKLKELKIRSSEGDLGRDPALAEFVRAVLLSGNGTLLVNNTFVEWSTIQAVRRARPAITLVSFGIRNKIKPFSSLLIYTDQEQASPIPTPMDTLGTYVDLEVFYQYIWQEFEKYAEYRRNTAYLFVGEGMDEMLLIAPSEFPVLATTKPVNLAEIFHYIKNWLRV